MSAEYSSNIDQIIANLKKKDRRAMQSAERGMVRGMEFFSGKIIREQMGGRPGLNVQTGTLRKSWVILEKQKGAEFVVTLGTRTKYARVHQYGYPPGNIPKRLHILEDFKKSGLRIIAGEIKRTMLKEYKR